MIADVQDLLELSAPGAEVEMVAAADLPPLQRRLLDHPRDMTGTLEAFAGARLTLRVQHTRRESEWLYRRVVLDGAGAPVEYGAIRIHLQALPPSLLSEVEAGREPLGGLLTRAGVEVVSTPRGFLRTTARAAREALEAEGELFGRLARLEDGAGRTLADVVEILPPFSDRD